MKETWEKNSSIEQIDIDHFDQTIEVYKSDNVYLNLLRLGSGIDSFVVGKPEVFDEIVQSLAHAKSAGTSGTILNKLFESVIRLSTRMRDTTGIAKDIVSLGDTAVKLVEEKAGLDSKKKVLLIGTGNSAALVAKSLNKKEIVLCGNSSSMIPPFTGTNYKGNLKCTYGKGTTFADVFLGTFASNHLFIYFINFMSNARSPFQTRPEKAFLRFIIWNGSEWKSLFIDNWRCNHVMDAENYKNEMEQTVKYKSLVLYKKRTDAESVEAKVAPGKGTKNSVRFRNYSRDCKTRESQGPNMPNAADEARKLAEQAPQAAGKRKRRRRRSTKKKRRKGKKKKTRKRR